MGKIVEFEGSLNSKIYLVGEAPGANEEIEGKPFVGGSGKLLNRLLMEAGMTREECRIGNVMRIRPPKNDFSVFYEDRQRKFLTPQLQEGISYLKEDIKKVNPNVVVVLGNEPLRALMNNQGITNWRGSILFSKELGCKIIPTFHPASLLRAWSNVPLVMFDFRRIHDEAKSPDLVTINHIFSIGPSFHEVMVRLDHIQNEKRIAFDVETDYDGHITALALAHSSLEAICIPFSNSSGSPYWTVEDEDAIWRRVKLVMEDEKIQKIAHNEQFDRIMFLINPHHIDVKGMWMDTMAAFHTVYPEIASSEKEGTTGSMKHKIGGGKKLALLCSIYTRQPYYKYMGKSGNDHQFWTYNCLDAAVTWECANYLEKEMKEFNVDTFYGGLVRPLLPICMDIQMRGVRVDEEMRVEAVKEYREETDRLVKMLNGAVGYEVNVSSPKQLKELLFDDLGFPPQYKRGSNPPRITTDGDALEALSKKFKSGIFDLILRIRRNNKLLGTYLEGNLGKDGRMRCSYIVGGTETGRLASRGSVFGSGTNLQNFPHGVCRRMLCADKGKVMVAGDLAQAEARLVAYLAEEVRMIEVFEKGEDIHQLSADALPPEFEPRGNEYESFDNPRRQFAKKHNHAFNYGEGPMTFAHRAGIDMKTARLIRDRYFDKFPSLRAWHLSIQAQLGRSRTMTTPLGRKRTFFGMWGESLFREAYAYLPQSTVGDLNNKAMINFAFLSNKKDGEEILLTTHDEIVVQCNKKNVGKTVEKLRYSFHIPLTIKGRTFVVPVEVKVGDNWEDLKKWED